MNELVPDNYAATLAELKGHVHAARFRVQRAANTELLLLWWTVGKTILKRQSEQGWGTGVLHHLADDLRAEFPTMKGFSQRNLGYMKAFAMAWPDGEAILQRPVAKLPSPTRSR